MLKICMFSENTWPPFNFFWGHSPLRKPKTGLKLLNQTNVSFVYVPFFSRRLTLNAGLDESKAGIKTDMRNINNLRYADDNILMAESEEDLKNFLMKVKEESEKADLKLNI